MTTNESIPEMTQQESDDLDMYHAVSRYITHVPGCSVDPCDCGMVDALALLGARFITGLPDNGITAASVVAKHRQAVRRIKTSDKAA